MLRRHLTRLLNSIMCWTICFHEFTLRSTLCILRATKGEEFLLIEHIIRFTDVFFVLVVSAPKRARRTIIFGVFFLLHNRHSPSSTRFQSREFFVYRKTKHKIKNKKIKNYSIFYCIQIRPKFFTCTCMFC